MHSKSVLALATSFLFAGAGADSCLDFVERNPSFSPMRIRVDEDDLGVLTSAQRNYLLDVLFPNAVSFFERSMQVRRSADPIMIDMSFAGKEDVILDEHDIIVFVSAMICESDGGEYPSMISGGFHWDDCGRPIAAAVSVCEDHLATHMRSDEGRSQLATGIVHELVHAFGFEASTMERWRDPETMLPRLPYEQSVWYHCEYEEEGQVHVEWDVAEDFADENMFKHTFLSNIVTPIDSRGLTSSDCRCPYDPSKTYTSEDIEYCMQYPEHCTVAVTTNLVKARSQEYFQCSSARGMEIENTVPFECGKLYEDHWKTRLLRGELMNSRDHQAYHFISPMTFAALEDSGWYKMDFSQLNLMIPATHWGMHAGCAFIDAKCLDMPANFNLDASKFCFPHQNGVRKCSSDATSVETCDAGLPRGTWGFLFDMPNANLDVYKYGPGDIVSAMRYYDFCPTYVYKNLCTTESRPENRCLVAGNSNEPVCVATTCSEDRSSYTIKSVSTACTAEGQIINENGLQYVCTDPSVICTDWKYSHLLPNAGINKRTSLV